jgi:uncharacterized protein (DUF362 family)
MKINRREFLLTTGCAAAGLAWADAPKARVGLVQSSHKKLVHPASIEDPLDYPMIRDMVWKAIEYGKPKAGSLEAKIRPGSWVVLKPNIAFLGSQDSYRSGDVTDFRVIKAIMEYVARKSQARRITIAEGGSYQAVHTKGMWEISQNGVRVDAETFDWGDKEFPGWGGTLGGMLREFGAQFPGRQFDYVNLNLDALRDTAGAYRYIEVKRSESGIGAFGARSSYCITNTIQNCDFLINVPVMKVHADCGVTACLKNYVGTAPREVYAPSWRYSNRILHDEYSVEDRIDGWVVDLGSFHPADYSVVDGVRGLQYTNHNNRKPDQMVRSNLVLAGEDAVAIDSVVTKIMGFNPWDFEYLHLAAQRDIGTMDSGRIEVIGDDPGRATRRWAKNTVWHGRCNREWLVTGNPSAPTRSWKRVTIPTDTLHLAKVAGEAAPGTAYAAAMRVRADGTRKGFLWLGVHGRLSAVVNGNKVLEEESTAACHVGQYKVPIELKPGDNRLEFQVRGLQEAPQVSALLVGAGNDGDTIEGIRYLS